MQNESYQVESLYAERGSLGRGQSNSIDFNIAKGIRNTSGGSAAGAGAFLVYAARRF